MHKKCDWLLKYAIIKKIHNFYPIILKIGQNDLLKSFSFWPSLGKNCGFSINSTFLGQSHFYASVSKILLIQKISLDFAQNQRGSPCNFLVPDGFSSMFFQKWTLIKVYVL